MNQEHGPQPRSSAAEKAWRFGRNVNIIGTLAVAGVALAIPGPNALLAGYAGFNAAQAGGFEWLRQRSAKKLKR